jgi:hypothetical protein
MAPLPVQRRRRSSQGIFPMNASVVELEPVTTDAAWCGDELSRRPEWIYRLGDAQVAELEALGARFVADDPDLCHVQAADDPLLACAEAVAAWGRDVDRGRGFVLVRGLRTELYSDALSSAIYYILGLHMASRCSRTGWAT